MFTYITPAPLYLFPQPSTSPSTCMPPSTLQSLASSRPRRPAKPTAHVQDMIERKQEQVQRGEQAKEKKREKAQVKHRANRINHKGDELMYRPAESFVAPTLTGDDNLDRQRSDQAEATEILQLLAYRGDGDWSLHYQSGEVGLPLLRVARDLPGGKIIEFAIGQLAPASPKGKGKGKAMAIGANDDNSVQIESSGQRSTAYSGITLGRSPSEPSIKQGHASPNLQRGPPSPRPIAAAKRPAPVDNGLHVIKKPRVDGLVSQKPKASSGSTQHEVIPAPSPGVSLTKQATYPKPVTFGFQGPTPVILGSQPTIDAKQPKSQKPTPSERRQDPPRSPKPGPSFNDPSAALAPRTLFPSPPAQPLSKQQARENIWPDWSKEDVPQPRKSKPSVATTSTSPLLQTLPSFQCAQDCLAVAQRSSHGHSTTPESNQAAKRAIAISAVAKPAVSEPAVSEPAVSEPA
ncbi:hypothetical protein BDV93DRAFT_565393, partial [Ceratobasidium sp. AG-I]